jgi:two-component system, LytTR family, response regulator
MNYKVIIIEDELRARELLREMIKMYTPELEIVAECHDLSNGVKAIRKYHPDIVFLDIEMPGHSGLEILDFFDEDEIRFSVIFTTAYNEYAVKAFKLSAIDYLTKPIEPEELKDSVERFKKKIKHDPQSIKMLHEILLNKDQRKIAVPAGNMIKLIDPEQILYIKADSSYAEIYFKDHSRLIVSRTLKNFEEVFGSAGPMFRCHKSYIVNLQYVTAYIKSDGYVILNEKINIPISPERMIELISKVDLVKR